MRLRRLAVSASAPLQALFPSTSTPSQREGCSCWRPTGLGKVDDRRRRRPGVSLRRRRRKDSTTPGCARRTGPSRESYVDLVFSVEAGTFRVRRTPQWTQGRKQKSDERVTKLWRLSESAVSSTVRRGRFWRPSLREPALKLRASWDSAANSSFKRSCSLKGSSPTSSHWIRPSAPLCLSRSSTRPPIGGSPNCSWCTGGAVKSRFWPAWEWASVEGLATALSLEGEAKAELAESVNTAGSGRRGSGRAVALAAAAVLRARRKRVSGRSIRARVEASPRASRCGAGGGRARLPPSVETLAASGLPGLLARGRIRDRRARRISRSPRPRRRRRPFPGGPPSTGRRPSSARPNGAGALLDASDRPPRDVDAATLESQTEPLRPDLPHRPSHGAGRRGKGLASSRRERTAAHEALRRPGESRGRTGAVHRAAADDPSGRGRLAAEEAEASRIESLELEAESLTALVVRASPIWTVRAPRREGECVVAQTAAAFEEARLLRDEQTPRGRLDVGDHRGRAFQGRGLCLVQD